MTSTWPWPALLAGLVVGALLGALFMALRARRESEQHLQELAALRVQLKGEEALTRERDAALAQASQHLQSTFNSLAGQSLRANSEVFLQLAREHLGQHQQQAAANLSEREKAIQTMLTPIREALSKTEQQIQQIEKERALSFGTLKASLEAVTLGQQALQQETRTLVNALRRPEVRGQWGELTLRRLAELAGMIEHCDFSEQVHVRAEGGALRPDMIVHMPDGRELVVDVKTPLDAYLEAVEANTEEQRDQAMRRHANAVAGRVKELGAKSYWSQFKNSPDFVILFIPGDQFLSAALAEQPSLLEDALRQDVIIATPSSFVALLKAVAYGWRQSALAENAQTIRTLAEDLYKRLAVFSTHLGKLGRNLGSAVDAFNASVGSLERQVLPGARKFTELGVHPGRQIEPLEPVEKLTRQVQDAPDTDTTQR